MSRPMHRDAGVLKPFLNCADIGIGEWSLHETLVTGNGFENRQQL